MIGVLGHTRPYGEDFIRAIARGPSEQMDRIIRGDDEADFDMTILSF